MTNTTPPALRTLYAMDARLIRTIGSQLNEGTASAHALVASALDFASGARILERRAVAIARAEGHTWSEIGDWLGISKQAAQQRYGR